MTRTIAWSIATLTTIAALMLAACGPAAPARPAAAQTPRVLAVETFLTDIAQNVGGDRLTVDALMPIGVDPHAFEPTP